MWCVLMWRACHLLGPVLLQYYSTTTLYYKVLVCTTKYYKVYSSTTPTVLQGTIAVLLCAKQYYSLLQRTTPAQAMLQRHQTLRLPRK